MERLGSGEVATLVIGLLAAFVLLQARRERPEAFPRAFLAGVGLILAAYGLTIAEAFVAGDLLNILEHAALALAGIAFLAAVLGRGAGGEGGG